MSRLHFCCGACCPGYERPASERAHPESCVGSFVSIRGGTRAGTMRGGIGRGVRLGADGWLYVYTPSAGAAESAKFGTERARVRLERGESEGRIWTVAEYLTQSTPRAWRDMASGDAAFLRSRIVRVLLAALEGKQ